MPFVLLMYKVVVSLMDFLTKVLLCNKTRDKLEQMTVKLLNELQRIVDDSKQLNY